MTARATRGKLAQIYGSEALERLDGPTVAVVGAGVLGGPITLHLGLLPLRQILVDPGRVELENLANQLLPAASLGSHKVEARARQIRSYRPDAQVEAVPARLEDLGLARLAQADLLVTAADTASTRIHAGLVAKRLGIPLVDGAVSGAGLSLGSVASYPPGPEAPCIGCRFQPEDLARLAREELPQPCLRWQPSVAIGAPTLEGSAFGAVIAGYVVLEVVRLLTEGAPENAAVRFFVAGRERGMQHAMRVSARCPFPHVSLRPLRATRAATPGELARQAEAELGAAVEALVLHERQLVAGLRCRRCRAERDVVRTPAAFGPADVRCRCGPEGELLPADSTDRVEPALLRRIADRSWEDLGLPSSDVVSAEAAGGAHAHYVVRSEPGPAPSPEARSQS